jgi:hypothetical protein
MEGFHALILSFKRDRRVLKLGRFQEKSKQNGSGFDLLLPTSEILSQSDSLCESPLRKEINPLAQAVVGRVLHGNMIIFEIPVSGSSMPILDSSVPRT